MLQQILLSILTTIRDLVPITLIILFFQFLVLRRPIANVGRVVAGFVAVLLGLALFLVGLDLALFPLGRTLANQLASPGFLGTTPEPDTSWLTYYWTYIFAFTIGFSATLAEPALLAVAIKASEVSGGTMRPWPLRIAVAIGAGFGVALGTFRIVSGIPLLYFIVVGYTIAIIQTFFAPKQIIPLAYDTGGVTTSTITVPLVAALGLGLASQIPNRSPIADGFGMIALAVLFPMITVMGYAQLAHLMDRYRLSSTE